MRLRALLACVILGAAAPVVAMAQAGVPIGFNIGAYPDFIRVPGYPVYYAPRLQENVFFYDGLYWVYARDNWHTSRWYNGPWDLVDRYRVPYYVLRVPVRYYRRPPGYFRNWRRDEPPRWGDRWGREWEREHEDWNRWDRMRAPAPAPLPDYQRDYPRQRYPSGEQQRLLHQQYYRYEPREPISRDHWNEGSPARRDEVERREMPPQAQGRPARPGSGDQGRGPAADKRPERP